MDRLDAGVCKRVSLSCKILLLLIAVLPGSWVYAQDASGAPPTLDLFPTQISAGALSAQDPVSLDVHLSAGAKPLSNITVSVFSNDGIQLARASEPQSGLALEPGSEHSWSLRLMRIGGLVAPAKVHIRVAFDVGQPVKVLVHRVLYATAEITPRTTVSATGTVTAQFIGSTTSLSHERAGQVFLEITNQDAHALEITGLRVYKPEFVAVGTDVVGGGVSGTGVKGAAPQASAVELAPGAPKSVAILSGQTRIIPLTISASTEVVPGKYMVMARVTLDGDDHYPRAVVASHEIEVTVLGESDLLKLVGVPSFLFLPGALMIITWSLFWSLGKTVEERAKFLLPATGSDFWVVAIALSLISAVIYPLLTAFFGERRDYLVAYGFKDFAYIFGFSIVCALFVFGGYLGLLGLRRLWKQRQLRQQTPQKTDSACQILDKLAKVGQDAQLRQAYPNGGSEAGAALVLEPWSTETQIWLAPPARLTLILPKTDPSYYEALDEQDRMVTGEITDPGALLKQIQAGRAAKWWTLDWKTVGTIQGPTLAKSNAWADLPRRAPLVR